MGWHYRLMGEEYGPITAKELQEIAEAGTISPDTLLRKSGMEDWVTADRVKGLFTENPKQPNPTAAKVEPQSGVQDNSQTTNADAVVMIKFTCPNCKKQYNVGFDMAGMTTTCTDCDSPLTVPDVHKNENKHETVRLDSPVQANPNSFLCTFDEAF